MPIKKIKEKNEQTVCINPATGETIGYAPVHSMDDLKLMLKNARVAQMDWAAKSVKERVRAVRKIREYLLQNKENLADTISLYNGKTKIDALVTEILPSALSVTYYCRKAKQFLKDKKISMSTIFLFYKRSRIVRVPYGVIGIFSPWNYPFSIPFAEVIKALLAGNAVILKVATESQGVGLALKECIEYSGLPEGIFSYINMPGKIAGNAFLENGINKLCFTGSVPVGKKLLEKASETLTPVSLELGGNDAMIVCQDADLHRAAAGAVWAGFQNCGQSCGGVERIYVQSSVFNEFMALLKQKTELLRIGEGLDYNNDLGAMTTTRQMETVKLHIKDALEKGARIYAQSMVPEEVRLKNFLPATVMTNVNHDMLLMKEETFGPVLGVMKFDSVEEAIELANDSNLGLTGSVWSRNKKTAIEIARKIEAGVVTINDHLMSHGMHETPWGGFKESGIGRTHGEIGFLNMTQPQVIVNDILPFVKKNLWWHPFSKKVYIGLEGVLDFLYAGKLGTRIKGLLRVLRIIPRMFKIK